VSVPRPRLTPWIIGTVVLCAALGAFIGRQVGDGRGGYVALISSTCAVIGSFIPGAVLWLRIRWRDHGKPYRGAA
jgi:uncharacterized protein YcfJ